MQNVRVPLIKNRLIENFSNVFLVWAFLLNSLPIQAAPRSGPDRPFTVDWRVIAAPAPHLRDVAVVQGKNNGIAVGDGGVILHTSDRGKSWETAKTPSEFKSNLRAVIANDALH